jgi:hypothetical protein
MTLTARRVEMMNQIRTTPMLIEVEDIETDSLQPAGTRVVLYFPIDQVKNITRVS